MHRLALRGALVPCMLILVSACVSIPHGPEVKADLASHRAVLDRFVPEGRELTREGKLDEAEKRLSQGLEHSGMVAALPRRVMVLSQMASLLAEANKREEAARYLQEATQILDRLPDEVQDAARAVMFSWIGGLRLADGRFDDAKTLLTRATSLARKANIPEVLAAAQASLGDVHRAQGRNEQALSLYGEAASLARERKASLTLFQAEMGAGEILEAKGEFPAAGQKYRAALSAAKEAAFQSGLVAALLALSQLHELQEQSIEALQHLEELAYVYEKDQKMAELAGTYARMGRLLAGLSRFSEAEARYVEAARLADVLGDRGQKADALLALVMTVHYRTGRYPEALRTLNDAAVLAQEHGATHRLAIVDESLGFVLNALGQTEDALAAFARAYDGHKTNSFYLGQVVALREIGGIRLSMRQRDQALWAYSEAERIATEHSADRVLLDVLLEAGESLARWDEGQLAEKRLTDAQALAQRLGLKGKEAKALHAMAGFRGQQGLSSAALELYERAGRVYRSVGDVQGYVVVLLHSYPYYFDLGRVRDALSAVHQALQLAEQMNDPIRITSSLTAVASAYRRVGQTDDELGYLNRARQVMQVHGDLPGLALLQIALARAYAEAGNLFRAVHEAEEAVRLYKGVGKSDGLALAQFKLFELYLRTQDQRYIGLLMEMCRTAISTADRVSGDMCSAMASLATAYRPDIRAPVFEVVVELHDLDWVAARIEGNRDRELRALTATINPLARLGRQAEALNRMARAREILAQGVPPNVEAYTRGQLAFALNVLGRPEEECRELGHVIALREAEVPEVAKMGGRSTLVSTFQDLYHRRISCLYDLYAATNGKDVRLAFEALEVHDRSQAQGLLQTVRAGKVGSHRSPEARKKLAAIEASLRTRVKERQNLQEAADRVGQSRIRELDLQIAELIREADNWRRQVAQVIPGSTAGGADFESAVRGLVDRLVMDDGAILVYRVQPQRSFVWVVASEGIGFKALPGEGELAEPVQALYALLRQRDWSQSATEFVRVAHRLFDTLLGPVRAELAGKKRLIVIPSGVLAYLPFEVLLEQAVAEQPVRTESVAFLVRKMDVSYGSSLSLLGELALGGTPSNYRWNLVAFGDPAMAADAAASGQERAAARMPVRRFESIPHSGLEVKTVAKLVGKDKARVFLQDEATEGNFKSVAAPGAARVFHIATHGILDERRPQLSGLVFSEHSAGDKRAEDGILYLYEVSNLAVDAELVVLSACDSGRGKLVRGEGVTGLAQAFLAAGARSIVMSLWQVDDEATAVLMEAFYKDYLQNRRSKAESLSNAKRILLGNPRYANPYLWASFILNGL